MAPALTCLEIGVLTFRSIRRSRSLEELGQGDGQVKQCDQNTSKVETWLVKGSIIIDVTQI